MEIIQKKDGNGKHHHFFKNTRLIWTNNYPKGGRDVPEHPLYI